MMDEGPLWDVVDDAEGDSVTTERLKGREPYFVDCRPYVDTNEQPHHLLCLTTGGTEHGNAYVELEGEIKLISRDEPASVLFTDTHIRVISERGHISFPYSEIDFFHWYDDPSIVIDVGRRTYYFELGRSVLSRYGIMEAVTFADDMIQSAQGNYDVEYTLEDLEKLERIADLRDRGAITDDEFQLLKRRLLG